LYIHTIVNSQPTSMAKRIRSCSNLTYENMDGNIHISEILMTFVK